MTTEKITKDMGKDFFVVTSQMTIVDVKDEDAGEYECFIQSLRETKKASKIITIHG